RLDDVDRSALDRSLAVRAFLQREAQARENARRVDNVVLPTDGVNVHAVPPREVEQAVARLDNVFQRDTSYNARFDVRFRRVSLGRGRGCHIGWGGRSDGARVRNQQALPDLKL